MPVELPAITPPVVSSAASVLAGTEVDGDWGLDGAGRLQPSRALRQRFDYLLQTLGQLPLESITGQLADLARQELSESQAAAVMVIWQKYLQLQHESFTTTVSPHDLNTVGPALAERQLARRRILGPAWAQAFFGDEETQLADLVLRPEPAAVNQTALIDRGTLDAAALERLRHEDTLQQQWQAKLAQTRREVDALRAAQELSVPQREQAIHALIDSRFSGGERLRARALLGLAPGAS